MDGQEPPVDDAAARAKQEKQESENRALLSLGIVFTCVGIGLFAGPRTVGVPFLVIGLVFLATVLTRRRRR
ncbi:hypothetical protein [Cellulomonas sp. Leaf395]|uniref:hypothetical protein n=1 Tax=Cellulomonas sp. Leaf395 TaxID=1736362 RepID=UPI0006F91A7A|nr:hypothetical protein [Cellulomonas sp. Leaf395]KQS98632.1 hypothetical protein ASG23_12775 [Cellulomonas sp. Leaf395]